MQVPAKKSNRRPVLLIAGGVGALLVLCCLGLAAYLFLSVRSGGEAGCPTSEPVGAASAVVGDSRANPIPAGSPGGFLQDYFNDQLAYSAELTVLSVTRPATDQVLAADPTNTKPARGGEYALVEVAIRCLDQDGFGACNPTYTPGRIWLLNCGRHAALTPGAHNFGGVNGVASNFPFSFQLTGEPVTGTFTFLVNASSTDLVLVMQNDRNGDMRYFALPDPQ